MTRPQRIALVGDEFPSESPDAGGLASYLERLALALAAQGHEVEVLVRTFGEPRVRDWQGVRVESVRPLDRGERGLRRRWARWKWRLLPEPLGGRLRTALALGRAFRRRDAERRFDWVQSSNTSLCGLFVPRRPGLRHLVRMSSERGLWLRSDGLRPGPAEWAAAGLERHMARRADAVYAPSRFLADHLRGLLGVDVRVVRPPLPDPVKPDTEPPARLPRRFLLHFGSLRRRKGTEALCRALPLAWRRAPDLRLVCAGRAWPPDWLDAARLEWGDRVRWLGALERRELAAVVARATACVLPSLADNLPNTAIESLAQGVPVIAFRGASLDELVESGRSGELVPWGDVASLGDALVRAWQGTAPWLGDGFEPPAVLGEMAPHAASQALLDLVGELP